MDRTKCPPACIPPLGCKHARQDGEAGGDLSGLPTCAALVCVLSVNRGDTDNKYVKKPSKMRLLVIQFLYTYTSAVKMYESHCKQSTELTQEGSTQKQKGSLR